MAKKEDVDNAINEMHVKLLIQADEIASAFLLAGKYEMIPPKDKLKLIDSVYGKLFIMEMQSVNWKKQKEMVEGPMSFVKKMMGNE